MNINRLPTVKKFSEEILKGNRVLLSKAITLIESKRADHQDMAAELLESLLPYSGNSIRIGITGVPGVGKSTFIESFGLSLVELNKKPAVLSIDPSSTRSKGSILGDKTRMDALSKTPQAYIRPSPAGSSLGGVARKTRETVFLCEAAGFDVIIIETVGVGQSETLVKDMVDFFLLLMLSGGGDDLQGIKRGIMEMADLLAINKADGNNETPSKLAAKTYQQALHLFPMHPAGWTVPVTTCSAIQGKGVHEIWQHIKAYDDQTRDNGFLSANRTQQNLKWYHDGVRELLEKKWLSDPILMQTIKTAEQKVREGKQSVSAALTGIRNSF